MTSYLPNYNKKLILNKIKIISFNYFSNYAIMKQFKSRVGLAIENMILSLWQPYISSSQQIQFYYYCQTMKQSRSASRIARNNSSTPNKSQSSKKNGGESQFYYCHFKNAIYMGGIKAFQKHGRGILIHDDGTSAVTSYFNDFKNGHNIYYLENCILSVEYQKNKIVQVVIRVSVYLLLLRLGKEQKPQGKCLLIDFSHRKIYYVLYRKGVITQKRQQHDLSIINKIFDLGNIQYIIGKNHAGAVKFQLERDENIASQRTSSKFQAGFYKKGHLNGLGFNLMIKDPNHAPDSSRPSHQIFIRLIDRGYYNNSNLNGMGEQRFKNGNTYWGNFRGGAFEGLGILKNQIKKNWVYGQFLSGNLCELLEYSHDGDISKLSKIVSSMHQRKNSWINKQIEMQPYQQFVDQIQNIIESNPTQEMNNLKSKKQQVLKKIQNNFLYEGEQQYIDNNSNQQNDPRSSNINASSRNRINQSNVTVRRIENQPQQSQMQESQQIYRSGNKMSRFKSEAFDPLTTKGSSTRMRQVNSRNLGMSAAEEVTKITPKKKDVSKSPIRKNGQNQQELSFALDSKRIIGRSRIFKQYSSQEQELPKFNYGQN